MKVILVNPPSSYIQQEVISVSPPLGLLYLGAVLERSGHHVKIVDVIAEGWRKPEIVKQNGKTSYHIDINNDHLAELVNGFDCDVFGISCLFVTTERTTIELAKKVKKLKPSVRVVVGGVNASARYEFLMECEAVDCIVIGEGEHALKDLLSAWEGGDDVYHIKGLVYRKDGVVVRNEGINCVENLDELPFPAYHLLENSMEEYFQGNFEGLFLEERVLPMCTSRGCVLNCVFCAGAKLFGKWRPRSPENVLREIEFVKEKYGVKEIAFTDSNINLDLERFTKLLNMIDERKLGITWMPWGGIFAKTFSVSLINLMRATGCHSIFMSVESGDPEMQKYIGKIVPLELARSIVSECRKFGIWTHGNFVVGLPGETRETMKRSFRYAKKVGFDSVSFFIAIPLPGTRYYDQIGSGQLLDKELLRFRTRSITWTEISARELTSTIRRFLISYAIFKITTELLPWRLVERLRGLDARSRRMFAMNIKRSLNVLRARFKG
jgi:anaerobic magnesium-protoporphyrin IX monomethyl ester cyclase